MVLKFVSFAFKRGFSFKTCRIMKCTKKNIVGRTGLYLKFFSVVIISNFKLDYGRVSLSLFNFNFIVHARIGVTFYQLRKPRMVTMNL